MPFSKGVPCEVYEILVKDTAVKEGCVVNPDFFEYKGD